MVDGATIQYVVGFMARTRSALVWSYLLTYTPCFTTPSNLVTFVVVRAHSPRPYRSPPRPPTSRPFVLSGDPSFSPSSLACVTRRTDRSSGEASTCPSVTIVHTEGEAGRCATMDGWMYGGVLVGPSGANWPHGGLAKLSIGALYRLSHQPFTARS